MKTLDSIPLTGRYRPWVLVINLLVLTLLTACTSGSSKPSNQQTPQNNFGEKIFVLGAQVDDFGNLVMYAIGTGSDGNALTAADWQSASVAVDGVTYTTQANPELTIAAVDDGDKILSLGLLTDYSNSTGVEVQYAPDAIAQMLDSLPLVYEAQVMTFSNELEVKQPWTEDVAAIKAAVPVENSVRDRTALYDSMGKALEGDVGVDGLVGRCRPAHMMVVFTDGYDNQSSVYTDTGIGAIVNNDMAVVIILSTWKAETDVLTILAGDSGAVVKVEDPAKLVAVVDRWASSLKDMVNITLDSSIDTTGKTVSIAVGSQVAEVNLNSHCRLPL